MIAWLERALTFEPAIEMKKKLEKNKETFAQYVVRVMSYSCRAARFRWCRAIRSSRAANRAAFNFTKDARVLRSAP